LFIKHLSGFASADAEQNVVLSAGFSLILGKNVVLLVEKSVGKMDKCLSAGALLSSLEKSDTVATFIFRFLVGFLSCDAGGVRKAVSGCRRVHAGGVRG
jgi:hypothetical protein